MEQVTVFYDGLCHLCSREINHYRTMKGSENLQFVDITTADFDAADEKLDPYEIHKTIHVRDRHRELHVGVNAFICIWNELPALQFLARLAKKEAVHSVLDVLYAGFAKVRPLLPRKNCDNSPYCEIRPRD